MNCWKTINLSKDYGFHRLFFLSFLTSILAFIFLFLVWNMIFESKQLEDSGLMYVVMIAILLIPGHQLIHLTSLWLFRKKVKLTVKKKGLFPYLTVKYCELLSKPVAVITVLAPLFTVSLILLSLSLLFPQYIHYFTILAAINFGICVSDIMYSYHFMKAPRKCFLEENKGGYDILVMTTEKVS
ncbi:DUF3267 domain-containing protein [Bacillus sp. BGMRC 2118]|nr:DUF3267 domain-containing protein [Bacillus sp. BGMRC 2118]